jgi:hypothetical protein
MRDAAKGLEGGDVAMEIKVSNQEWNEAIENNSDADVTDYRGVCDDVLTLKLASVIDELEELKSSIPAIRVKSRLMGVDDGMKACEKVVCAARLFCESTMAEMGELEGTESAAAPAEFMLLHEAVQEFDNPQVR